MGASRPWPGWACPGSAEVALEIGIAEFPRNRQAAIQFAHSLVCLKSATGAANRLVRTSPKAMRAEAAGFTIAKGGLMFEASISGQKFTFTPYK